MRNNIFNLALVIILGLVSCNTDNNKEYFNMETKVSSSKLGRFVVRDTITLTLPATSYVGEVHLDKGRLYFIDQVFCIVNECSIEDGNFIKAYLGKGMGPNEVPRIGEFLSIDDGFIITHDWLFYVFDNEFNLKVRSSLNWQMAGYSDENLENKADASNPLMYEVEYISNRIRLNSDGREVYFRISTEHPLYNAFISRGYYKSSRIIASVDFGSGRVSSIDGRLSPAYDNYEFIPFHNLAYYDFVNGNFYIGYEPDSLIYVYDQEFNPLYRFGRQGMDISLDFRETSYLDAFQDAELEYSARNKEGYYKEIDVIPEHKLVFRKYQTDSETHRLQAFRELDLVADIEVSEGFRVIGEHNGFIYAASKIDEEEERIDVIRFTIE